VVEVGLGEQDGELLAADARRHVYAARAGLQRVGEAAQHVVAHVVAVRVVDPLEVVNVEHQQAKGAPVPARARDLAL
jgi:hypothetical protein